MVIPIFLLLMRQHLTRKNPEVVMCPIPWLCVVIYCKCTEMESEPRNNNQGRPPIIMTSATSRKYSIRWFYVVIRSKPWLFTPVRGYTTCCSPYAPAAYQENQGVVMWTYVAVDFRLRNDNDKSKCTFSFLK